MSSIYTSTLHTEIPQVEALKDLDVLVMTFSCPDLLVPMQSMVAIDEGVNLAGLARQVAGDHFEDRKENGLERCDCFTGADLFAEDDHPHVHGNEYRWTSS